MGRIRVAVVVPSDSSVPTPPRIRIAISIEARIAWAPIPVGVAVGASPAPAPVSRMTPTPAAKASSPRPAMRSATINCTSAEPASAMRDESAMTPAAHGHSTATASLPPHRSGQHSRAQGRHENPAPHTNIISPKRALAAREFSRRKSAFRSGKGEWQKPSGFDL